MRNSLPVIATGLPFTVAYSGRGQGPASTNPPGAARIDGAPAAWRTAAPQAAPQAAPEIAIDHRPATLVIARTGAPRRP